MKFKLNMLLAAMLVLAAVILSACSGATSAPASVPTPSSAVTPKPAEIVLAAPRDLAPGAQDAFYTSYILYVWEPLLAGGEDGQPVPKLASSWSMSPDGKEWTFKLRENVVFHDGEKLNADAVIANFNRYNKVSPKSSPFYTLNVKTSYPSLQAVTKVDELTFKLTFGQPQPTLPYAMVNFSSPIYSPKNFDEKGDFNGLPQGTGPFKLKEHKKDSHLVLEANEAYYGPKAKEKRIVVRTIPSPDTRLAALKAGEIHGVMDLGALPPEQAQELLKDKRFDVSVSKSTISHYLHPNGKKAPLQDVRVRQAISLAIDRAMIVKELYRGYPVATADLINYTSPFYKATKTEANMVEAKKLSQEALGGKRHNLLLIVPSHGIDRYPYKAQAELIQAQLKEIGLDVEIRILDTAAFRDAQAKGDYDLALATQGLPNAEPLTILQNYMHSDGSANKSYSLGYKNAKVDDLLKKAAAELRVEERRSIYHELQEIAAKELPTIPLFHDSTLIAFDKSIKGYKAQVYGTTLPELQWGN